MPDPDIEKATEVKRRHEQELLSKANVVAVGVGFRSRGGRQTRDMCIVVSVKAKVPRAALAPADLIPESIEGIPVDVVETGPVRAL